MRILPYGPRASLVEYDSIEEVMAASARLRRAGVAGVREIVPAARTVLVVHDGGVDRAVLDAVLADVAPVELDHGDLVEIGVVYDGADLAEVASLAGWSVDDVVARHQAVEYRVAFCGFVPGFAYLVGLPAELHVPRLATPRPRVDAGSVAIAGEWAGVYPSASPGGWRLLGHTDAVMWDEARARPSLLEPGMRVRFVAR
ncbi:MAG: allophanate hydrolase subunit 1 [Acidimicrobiales bacterium]|nr:allophanate hydrolase subunit 1 [Acidimicrobiales bacterium]MCB9394556.1 allophanate hydrolase subunit 1 [Acidimicrobiaceae bacterium]